MSYAKGTSVSVDKTEGEIKVMLKRHGATATAFAEDHGRALIMFHLNDRSITFRLPLPGRDEKRFTQYQRGSNWHMRTESAAYEAWEQACRERWRALLLCIKAKLESVEQGIETFDDAFLAHIQMPDGETVGDKMRAELPAQLAGHPLRPLLGGPAAK